MKRLVDAECVYCGDPATENDHVVPYGRGGSDLPENLVPACKPCNQSKGNRTPDEWIEGISMRASGVSRGSRVLHGSRRTILFDDAVWAALVQEAYAQDRSVNSLIRVIVTARLAEARR